MGVAALLCVLLLGVLVVGVELGGAAGAVAGIAAGAVATTVARAFGTWNEFVYVPMAALVTGFVVIGFMSGTLGAMIRALTRVELPTELMPARGSLGLLHPSVGEERLDDEIGRAAYGNTPLSVVAIHARALDGSISDPDRGRLVRVVGRTVESSLDFVHIPFAYDDAEIVAILPLTDDSTAVRLVEEIRRACAVATVVVGPGRERRRFSDLGAVEAGLSKYPEDGSSAQALIEAARARARRPRPEATASPVGVMAWPEAPAPVQRVPTFGAEPWEAEPSLPHQ